jgi:multiple sugar transport system ATP-binding protein
MAQITLDGITKRYPDGFEAVRDMSLEIDDGEFVILVGPSGCGKSTALRMIAGLEDITEGELRIGDEVVNEKAPKDRDIAMVFQNYALYPHMTVRDNMGFALKLRGVDKGQIDEKVEEAARVLDLEQHLDRRPANLSGGQRQRVAMGRAIVRDPSAFLMDEPLSNLDAKLRVQMRTEVSRIQRRLGTTTVYVTHDQTEAMTLGDRVAVMRAGELQQVGSPMTLYNEPVNLFVAGFIGSPAMNFMPATLEGDTVKLPIGDVRLPQEVRERLGRVEGKNLIAGIRPEAFEDAELTGEARDRGTTFQAKIEVLESMGSELFAHFSVASDQSIDSAELRELAEDAGGGEVPMEGEEGRIVARLDPASKVCEGDEAELWVDATRLVLFDPEDGRNLTTDQSGPAATRGEGATEPAAVEQPESRGDGDAGGEPGATGGTR